MKIQVVFDATGNVSAMLFPSSQAESKGSLGGEPIARLKAGEKQHVATLKIPPQLREPHAGSAAFLRSCRSYRRNTPSHC
jgi:hypothetical protein